MGQTAFPAPRKIAANGIELAVYESGSGDPVVLCHGFPELAYSWRYQLPALSGAGFRAIAPDLRGFGLSDKPEGIESYDVRETCADMTGLLDALGLERAIFVGHDWGAILLWQMALLHPERMRGFVAVNIPFYRRPPVDPTVMMRDLLGENFYIVNFLDSDESDRAFNADPERFFRSVMRRLPITRAQFEQIPEAKRRPYSMLDGMRNSSFPGQPLLSEDELQVFVDAYRRGGFTPPINWYRNWARNWELTKNVEQRVCVPTLFVGAVDDILITPNHIERMRLYVDKLEIIMIKNCGHWTQQERPNEFNGILLEWLNGVNST